VKNIFNVNMNSAEATYAFVVATANKTKEEQNEIWESLKPIIAVINEREKKDIVWMY